ncbi:MAG: hypothetical protein M3O32_06840 [Actinomycetota bacterium]|nr:hypothetical protein [Actinomycetota bacterium]
MTAVNWAELSAELASLYFWPTTLGAPAFATAADSRIAADAVVAASPTLSPIFFTLTSADPQFRRYAPCWWPQDA